MHTISFVHCGPLSSDSRVNTRAQAVQYFQRALRLDRAYLSAWTLMGHEFVELKNPPAAIGARPPAHPSPRGAVAMFHLPLRLPQCSPAPANELLS